MESNQENSFEHMFLKLITHLKKNDIVVEVSNHFSSKNSLSYMFEYLSNLDFINGILNIKINFSVKSDEQATTFRNQGNKFYTKKALDQALELYNKSILISPHPEPKSEQIINDKCNSDIEQIIRNYDLEGKEFKSLAMGLANRSAVLYELKQFQRCISDCDLALLYGYPKILASKLSERKAKCYLSLGEIKSARDTVEGAIKNLHELGLEEGKISTTMGNLEDLLSKCSTEGGQKYQINLDKTSTLVTKKNIPINYLFNYDSPSPPQLTEVNDNIPSLSKAVKVSYSPDRGRFLIANRDIAPGEVLIAEKSYSSVILFEHMHTHCSLCLKRTLTGLPCPSCSKVVFCSESCRAEALQEFHAVECNLLNSLEKLDLGKNAQLAIRLIIQTKFKKLLTFVPEFEKKLKETSPEYFGYNEKGIYDSKDYNTIYSLVTNKESRSVADLFKRTAIAYTLLRLLLEGRSFFFDNKRNYIEPSNTDLILLGNVIMNHLMHVPCNAHSITEFGAYLPNLQDSVLYDIGAGAFGVLSLCNHSCDPSGARTSFGKVEIFRSISNIKAGDEITDSYGKHFAMEDIKERQSILKTQYYFQCTCDSCTNKWPIYERLSSEYSIKCVKCPGVVSTEKKICSFCNISYSEPVPNDDGTMFDFNSFYQMLREYSLEYNEVYKFVLLGDSSPESIRFLENYLLLFKHIQLPNKLYFEVQETLKHCYDKCGAYFYDC